MYQRIIHYAFRPLELSGIDKSHFSSRHSTRWLSFPLFKNVCSCGGRKTGGPREKLSEQRQEPTTNSTHMSNITLPLFFWVTTWNSWFIEERNSFLAKVNLSGPTHVSLLWFSMGSWVRVMPQGPYHNSHYFSSVALFSLGNLIKLILCFAGRKKQFGSQLFASHPLNAFVCSCLLVK